MTQSSKETFSLDQIISGTYFHEVQELLANKAQASLFEDYENFFFLILRRMSLEENSLKFIPEVFIILPEKIFMLDRESNQFFRLNDKTELVRVFEKLYSQNSKILSAYSTEIEKLEDFLFQRNIPSYFMDLWFDLKKDLTRIENFYYRNLSVYKEYFKKFEKKAEDLKDEFKDIEDSINFQSSNVDSLKARLDSLHHYYASIKNDRLNKTIFMLTIISGIFLPLNLIVGFFGMNTEGMFFKDDPIGTQHVVMILGGVVILFLLGVRIFKWVDHYLLRFLLGRYDFYKSILNRVEKFDDHFKGK